MTKLEWPPGSGRVAEYTDQERAFMRRFAEQKARGEISAAECNLQIGHFHDLKVEFPPLDITTTVEPESRPSSAAGRAARDEAIKRVDMNADPAWKHRAQVGLRDLCLEREEFTTDDLWVRLGWMPHEPRAIGPIMLHAARTGWIEKIEGRYREAHRGVNHARPQQVWRSLLYARRALM